MYHVLVQVCRKIGDKLRQSQPEQSEHVLIAVYARTCSGDDAGDDGGGGSGGGGGSSSDEGGMGIGWGQGDEGRRDRLMATESFHAGDVARWDGRRRR